MVTIVHDITLARETSMRPLLLAALIIGVLATPLLAQTQGGQVGNLNLPAGTAPGILVGNQTLAYLIQPEEQVSCPEQGFQLQNVRVYLEFSQEQVPVTLNVAGGLLQAVPDGAGYVPGDALFLTDPMPMVITEPGLQLIEVPVEGVASCELLGGAYFLALQFVGPAAASLVIDDQPAPGIEFIDSGNGFIDMNGLDKASGGKVIIWGDIICCLVTASEGSTWHQIKQIFD